MFRIFCDSFSKIERKLFRRMVKYSITNDSIFINFPAFYENTKEYIEVNKLDENTTKSRLEIADNIVKSKLAYVSLPKALIKMYVYGENALPRLMSISLKGKQYLNQDIIYLHFTIAENYGELFKRNRHCSIAYE